MQKGEDWFCRKIRKKESRRQQIRQKTKYESLIAFDVTFFVAFLESVGGRQFLFFTPIFIPFLQTD
jgi:hypothetical protein